MPPPTADEYRAGLLALQQQQRARLTSLIEQVDGTLAYNWQRGVGAAASLYGPLLDQYAKDLAALRAAEDDPAARLTLSWLTNQNPLIASIDQSVAASVEKYAQQSATTISTVQATAAEMAASDASALTQRSLWPAVEGAGVPPSVLFNRPNPDAIAQWVGRAGNGHPLGDLFQGFGAEATQGARQAMMLGLLTGANPKAMASGIANALGVSRSRATIISRTEVLGSYRAAAHETYRANSDVLSGWIWSAGGQSPCAQCMGMDGLIFSLEEELIDHPCFPAGMLVSGPRALGSTTRWYEGDLIDITTRDGRFLSVTPNHPILTPHGWIMAGLLVEGDDVVCHDFTERGHTPAVGTPDDYQVPTPIEQVASAFGRANDVPPIAVPLAAEDFNGNRRVGVNGEIDVVGANRVLRDAGNRRKARRQPRTQKRFGWRDAYLALLTGLGAANLLPQRLAFAMQGRLSRKHGAAILFRGTFSGFDAGGGRWISTHDASSHQSPANGSARDAELLSERLLSLSSLIAPHDVRVRQTLRGPLRHSITHADEAIASLTISQQAPSLQLIRQALLANMEACGDNLSALPGDICLDRVLEISVRRFSGHVYNLQTVTGWYITSSIITHNCGKCAPIPITKSWDEILGPLGIDSSDMEETSMGAEGAYETGPEKFARMSPEQQRAIIGTKTGYEAYQRGEVELKDFIGKREAEGGWPASYYQKSLKEMEIPTGRAGTPLVERSPRLTELERAGNLRARDFGAPIHPDEMPRWARKSPASQAVYQIMRNGLPWNMAEHELPLLSQNIEQMLTEDLSLNVRMAALRLQDMLKQYDAYLERYIRNVTSGASTLGKAPEFVYKPSRELERALAAARAGERAVLEGAEQTTAREVAEDVAGRTTVTYADDAVRQRISAALGRDISDNELANLAGAPPGSRIEVGRYGEITVTPPDGRYTSSVFVQAAGPGDDGPMLLNWRFEGPDGANTIAVDPEALARQVKQANALGITDIHMKARYQSDDFWQLPDLGYDIPIGPALVESASKELPAGLEDVQTLQQLLAHPEGRAWWRAHGMNPGFDFDPRPGSLNWRILDAYLRAHGMEGLSD